MGIRDQELGRLISYARGHNITVTFKSYIPYSLDSGYAAIDSSEIIIMVGKDDSKLETIMTLIHEIAHCLYVIQNNERAPDPALEEALDSEDEKKQHRKVIFKFERSSAKLWEDIYRNADLKFPINKLLAQKEYDVWQYEYWYKHAKFPIKKIREKKWKKVKEKYATKI